MGEPPKSLRSDILGAGVSTLLLWTAMGSRLLAESPSTVLPENLERLEPAVAELVEQAAEEVDVDPGSAARHGRLGMVYEANNLWPEAETCYSHAVSLDPKDGRWRFRWAVANRQIGNLDKELELLEQLATESPKLAPVQQRLALARLERGDLAGARKHFQRLRELEPDLPQGLTGLANVHLQEGDAEDAATLLEAALDLDPEDRQAHYLLGLAYRSLGRREEASQQLARGLGATPSYLPDPQTEEIESLSVHLTARLERAGRYLAQGQAKPAVELLETVLADHPDNLQVMNNLSIAYLRLGRTDDALALLRQAIALDDEGFASYMNLSAAYMRLGQSNEALAAADAAVVRAPEVARTHLGRAGVLGAMGRYEEARSALERVVDLEPDNVRAHLMLGRVLNLLRRHEAAAAEYLIVLGSNPDDLQACLGLAEARLGYGDVPGAREFLERARALSPQHPGVIQLVRELEREVDG